MSQSNLPQTLPTLQKMIMRISMAEKSQQKEIRISIQEARDLSLELSLFTAKMGNNIQEIKDILTKISENSQKIDIKFDGGGF